MICIPIREVRRCSSTAALKIESPVPVPILVPARRTDNINTYHYGVRDGVVWDGVGSVVRSVVRDGVGSVMRSGVGNVVRFGVGNVLRSGVENLGMQDNIIGGSIDNAH